MIPTRPRRLPAAERRELILDAASIVFGERGYAGTTTDAVADAAGVSQAYIVRLFGTKEALFSETAARAVARIETVFRSVSEPALGAPEATRTADQDTADQDTADAPDTAVRERLGRAYVGLVSDRGILLTVMHLFTLGHHPTIGPLARGAFLSVYRILRDEVGLSPAAAQAFLAQGMLINTLLSLRIPDIAATQADAQELLSGALSDAAEGIVTLTTRHPPLGPSPRQ